MPQGHHRHLNRSQIVRRYAIRKGSKGDSVRLGGEATEWQTPVIPKQTTTLEHLPVVAAILVDEKPPERNETKRERQSRLLNERIQHHIEAGAIVLPQLRRGPKKKGHAIKCEVCGTEKYYRPSSLAFNRRYCSRACAAKAQQMSDDAAAHKLSGELSFIEDYLPKDWLPELVDELRQDIVLALLEKRVTKRTLKNQLPTLILQVRRRHTLFGPLSIDQPIGPNAADGDFTLLDVLQAPTSVPQPANTPEFEHERKRRGGQYNGEYIHCAAGCGNTFYVTPYLFKQGHRYCSRECAWKSKVFSKKAIPKTCLNCGQAYQAKRIDQKWCSSQCASQAFHRKATKEARCHWCGKPIGNSGYKNACPEHVSVSRETNSLAAKSKRTAAIKNGVCLYCSERPREVGYNLCQICLEQDRLRGRTRRAKQKSQRLSERRAQGHILISEAAKILGVKYQSIHYWINSGKIRLTERVTQRAAFVELADVITLRAVLSERVESCPKGHSRTPENVGIRATGHKYCKVCNREAEYHKRQQVREAQEEAARILKATVVDRQIQEWAGNRVEILAMADGSVRMERVRA